MSNSNNITINGGTFTSGTTTTLYPAGSITGNSSCGTVYMTSGTGTVYITSGTGGYSYTTANGSYGGFSSPSTVVLSADHEIDFKNKPVKIKTSDGDIDLNLLAILMKHMTDILCIVRENTEKLEEYPALKAAFDEYKLIEAIVRDE